ncbi:hypothetical protein BSKO_06930 [Bryopsis sp. KO-2023]|nr:hypothetical protein BSKO_06930 [Bryopsis sp. KO-2023]
MRGKRRMPSRLAPGGMVLEGNLGRCTEGGIERKNGEKDPPLRVWRKTSKRKRNEGEDEKEAAWRAVWKAKSARGVGGCPINPPALQSKTAGGDGQKDVRTTGGGHRPSSRVLACTLPLAKRLRSSRPPPLSSAQQKQPGPGAATLRPEPVTSHEKLPTIPEHKETCENPHKRSGSDADRNRSDRRRHASRHTCPALEFLEDASERTRPPWQICTFARDALSKMTNLKTQELISRHGLAGLTKKLGESGAIGGWLEASSYNRSDGRH